SPAPRTRPNPCEWAISSSPRWRRATKRRCGKRWRSRSRRNPWNERESGVGPTTDGELYLGPAAAERVRREIARAGGNEVSFLAPVGEGGELRDPRVVARGNASAVLAAVRDPRPGGVLVHNHPSGALEPSHADLAVAERLWEMGIGFAITDNAASELYVVLEPPEARDETPLELDGLEQDLAPGGAIARAHGAYEDRPQQRELSRLIGAVYNDGGIGIAEAGT